jgi:hypothetical protein
VKEDRARTNPEKKPLLSGPNFREETPKKTCETATPIAMSHCNASGMVGLVWTVDHRCTPPRFKLRWTEKEGPPVTPPDRRGFGTRLVERSLAQDMCGQARIEFARTGVICTVDTGCLGVGLNTALYTATLRSSVCGLPEAVSSIGTEQTSTWPGFRHLRA